jgi:bifunctional DNA-binding transcriptional regulator/antitoxin component of YhaV-PrlF toxin-antitoxin module
LLGVAHLNEKSQLVVPKEAREILGVGPGDRVILLVPPFVKGILIARPEEIETHLQNAISKTEQTIRNVRKKMKD